MSSDDSFDMRLGVAGPYLRLRQLRARAEKAEADLAVVVEVLRRAGAATITVPCNWRTVAVANTHGLGFVRAVDTSTDEHDVLRRLLTEGTDMSDTNEVGSETHYVVHCPDNGGPHDYVVVKGDPINGTVVGHYPTFTVARAAACMTDVEEWAKSVYMPRDDINAFIANLQRIPSSLLLAHLLTEDNQT